MKNRFKTELMPFLNLFFITLLAGALGYCCYSVADGYCLVADDCYYSACCYSVCYYSVSLDLGYCLVFVDSDYCLVLLVADWDCDFCSHNFVFNCYFASRI